jgi:ABC-type branched-subunit amino acid transport system ATPase component
VLSARDITVHFGGLTALSEVSIAVPKGQIIGLVGPNGAGKSTLFAVLSGLLRPNAGRVRLAGTDVTGSSPQARARLGLARTFQQPELFMGLTVREHLVLAYRARHARSRVWKDLFLGGALRRPGRAETARVDGLLELLSMTDIAHRLADALPLGTSRMVEVGRALASSPSVVLLDEPLSGLDVHEAERMAGALRRIVDDEQVSFLLVEHDVGMVLSLSDYMYVLDFGALIAEGPPQEIRTNPTVRDAYLGDAIIASTDPADTDPVDGSPDLARSAEPAGRVDLAEQTSTTNGDTESAGSNPAGDTKFAGGGMGPVDNANHAGIAQSPVDDLAEAHPEGHTS